MHRCLDIRLVIIQWPWNRGYGSLNITRIGIDRSDTHDFLLTFHSNHWPISYRFPDKRQFLLKIEKNFPPREFCRPLKAFPLEMGNGAGGQKLEWRATGPRKKFDDIFSRLDTIQQVRDRQTDRRTAAGDSRDARLRIASRGKSEKKWGREAQNGVVWLLVRSR